MADALYIGSLVVEKIAPKPKGEPSIELIVTSTANGEIIADAVDLDTGSGGEHHSLNVSLKSLDEDNRENEIPDFELEHHDGPPSQLYTRTSGNRKNFPWFPVIIIGLVIVLCLLAAWVFFFRGRPAGRDSRQTVESSSGNSSPEPAALPETAPEQPRTEQSAPEQSVLEQPRAEQPAPVIQAPAAPPPRQARRERPPAPVSSYNVPAVIPREGVNYRIRWGDTLWDISAAFYRNPWLYPRIARFNNIRNPDRIISGTIIRIPPGN
jgi:hypothetical protein